MPARGSSHLISTIIGASKKKSDGAAWTRHSFVQAKAAAGTLAAPHAHAVTSFEPTWDFLVKQPEGLAGSAAAALKIRGSGLA